MYSEMPCSNTYAHRNWDTETSRESDAREAAIEDFETDAFMLFGAAIWEAIEKANASSTDQTGRLDWKRAMELLREG